MNDKRVSIFDDQFDVDDFSPKLSKIIIDKEGLKELAERKGFSSRDPYSEKKSNKTASKINRRNLTGRNKQLNIRVTQDTFTKFYKIADENRWTLGETLEECLKLFK